MRQLCLLWLIVLLGFSVQAQQLGATVAPPPEDEDADHELARLLKNQSSADTAFVRLRFGLFGPSAKKMYEEGERWAKEGRWNIALAYWYRSLDRNNKKTNEQAKKQIATYGPKFLQKCNDLAIQAFNANDGRSGYLYAYRLVREVNTAGAYGVRIGLTQEQFTALNEAAESWAQRRLKELRQLAKDRKHFTLLHELGLVGTYVPESRKTVAFRELEEDIETNGIRYVALPMFRSTTNCGDMAALMQASFMDRLSNMHRLVKVTSREINDELESEKIFAEMDDRPLTTDLKANLPGADYLVAGKVLTCDEQPHRLRRSYVDAWQVRSYTVKDTSGEETTRYCWDIPVKLEAVSGGSSVSYTIAVSTYRVADGKVIYTRRLDKSFGSSVDYLYAPAGNTDVSTVKIPEGSSEKPKRFGREVKARLEEPASIPDLRRRAVGELDLAFAQQVFTAIVQDN